MANKTAQSGSKARKGPTNLILSASSGAKVQPRPDPISKPNSHLHGSTGSVSTETRRIMIAETAYYISERRGFETGREMEDWLLAEKQVDAALSGQTGGTRAALEP